jgi:hypothetical protein
MREQFPKIELAKLLSRYLATQHVASDARRSLQAQGARAAFNLT